MINSIDGLKDIQEGGICWGVGAKGLYDDVPTSLQDKCPRSFAEVQLKGLKRWDEGR